MTKKKTTYKIYDINADIYVSLQELNPDIYEVGKNIGGTYTSKEEILSDLKEFHMEYGEDVTLEEICLEYGWRIDIQKTNFRRLISVRSQYGKWKSYDIVFDTEDHWDRWTSKMWDWGYKLESVYDYLNCKVCCKEHLKGSCKVECCQCQNDMGDNVITTIDGRTMCTECYGKKINY